MKFFVLTAVLVSCAVSSLGTAVTSDGSLISKRSVKNTECCHCGENIYHRCDDGGRCTPYCGRGDCNLFGCNCDGGCRPPRRIKSKQQSLESKESILEASESSDFFDITDANNDGVITINEWLDSPVRSSSTSGGESCSMLVKQWAKFDPANVGYLTRHQAINRKA